MTPPDSRPSLADLIDRRVSAAELKEALARPLSDEEREGTLSLVRWFRRRYATPSERLAYVRQAYCRWQQSCGTRRTPAR